MLSTSGLKLARLLSQILFVGTLSMTVFAGIAKGEDAEYYDIKASDAVRIFKVTGEDRGDNKFHFRGAILKSCIEKNEIRPEHTYRKSAKDQTHGEFEIRFGLRSNASDECKNHSANSCAGVNWALAKEKRSCLKLSEVFYAVGLDTEVEVPFESANIRVVSQTATEGADEISAIDIGILKGAKATYKAELASKKNELCASCSKLKELFEASKKSSSGLTAILQTSFFEDKSGILESIGKADTHQKVRDIESNIEMMSVGINPETDAGRSLAEVRLALNAKKDSLKGDEFTEIKSLITKAKDLDALEALKAQADRLIGNVKEDDKKAPRAQRELAKAYRQKYESLLESYVRKAKEDDFDDAMAKLLEYAEDHDSFVTKAEGLMEAQIKSRASRTKDKEVLEELTNVAQNFHSTLSGSDDYEGTHYRDTIAFIAGRRMATAKGSDEEILEEFDEVKSLLEDTKSDLDDESVASLDSLIVDMDLKRARVELRPALQNVMEQIPFVGAGQAQWMARQAIADAFNPLIESARSNRDSACYGYSSSHSSAWGGSLQWNSFSQSTPSPSVENRLACGQARSSFNKVSTEVTSSVRMSNSFIQRSLQDAQSQQQNGGLPGAGLDNGSIDPMMLGLTPSTFGRI